MRRVETPREEASPLGEEGPSLLLPPGQGPVLASALRAGRGGRMAQAWLITGPAGVGKRDAARVLVAAQFCASRLADGAPCGRCPDCRAVARGIHQDLHWTDATGRLGIAEARVVGRAAALRPYGTVSVFVVEGCERLTGFAAAALLKTLEDPPGASLFLLLTQHPEQLEPTLRSRCQLLRLHPAPPADLAEWLRAGPGAGRSPQELLRIAVASGGLAGAALAMLEGIDTAGREREDPPTGPDLAQAITAALGAPDLPSALQAASRLVERRASAEDLLAVLRDLVLARRGALDAAGGVCGAVPAEGLPAVAADWAEASLGAACGLAAEAADAAAANVNQLLNWERLVIQLRHLRGAC